MSKSWKKKIVKEDEYDYEDEIEKEEDLKNRRQARRAKQREEDEFEM